MLECVLLSTHCELDTCMCVCEPRFVNLYNVLTRVRFSLHQSATVGCTELTSPFVCKRRHTPMCTKCSGECLFSELVADVLELRVELHRVMATLAPNATGPNTAKRHTQVPGVR